MKNKKIKYLLLISLFLTQELFSEAKRLTLEDCITIALKNNTQIKQLESKLQSAKYKKLETISSWLPKAQLQARFSQLSEPQIKVSPTMSSFLGSAFPPTLTSDKLYTLNFSVNQLLFSSGKVYNAYQQASLNYEITEQEYKKAKNDLIIQVKESFYRTILAKEVLSVGETAVKISSENFTISSYLYNEGRASYLDLSSAKINFLNAKTNLLKMNNAYKLSMESLKNVLNIDYEFEVVGELSYEEFDVDYEKLKKGIYSMPELKSLVLQRKSLEKVLNITKTEVAPVISLSGSYDWTIDDYTKSFDLWDDRYSWNLIFSWPIFNGGGTFARYKQVKESINQVRLLEENVTNLLLLELNSLYFNYQQLKETLVLNKESLSLAEENLTIARTYYTEGRVSYLELLQSELNYTQAKIAYLQTLADYLINLSKIKKFVSFVD
jgi:outer membrane protein TolC